MNAKVEKNHTNVGQGHAPVGCDNPSAGSNDVATMLQCTHFVNTLFEMFSSCEECCCIRHATCYATMVAAIRVAMI